MNMINSEVLQPLVSVVVVTYNSSKTIRETLNSIKNQTYNSLELIISDDCSSDETVDICRTWLKNNINRFVRTHLILSGLNTGVSANLNRGVDDCKGEWVKIIAGDDMLESKCIEIFIQSAQNNPNEYFFFSRISVFGLNSQVNSDLQTEWDKNIQYLSDLTSKEQLSCVLSGKQPPAPAFFYNRNKYKELGVRNDERIRNIEDVPKWIMILSRGGHFSFVEERLVKYRVGAGISTSDIWNTPQMMLDRRMMYLFYIFPEIYKSEPEKALSDVLSFEMNIYDSLCREKLIKNKIKKTILYKCLKRIKDCKKIFSKR